MNFIRFIKQGIIMLAMILVISISPASTAMAYTDGPNNPEVATNESTIGTESWQNPENITIPGYPYASVPLYQGHQKSNFLQASDYGFNIPLDMTIMGIEVSINRNIDFHNANIIDNVVSLLKDGTIIGENKAMTTTWPTTFTLATYGGATDLWGTTWLPADINASGFGLALAAVRDNNGTSERTAVVDSIQITVYYENNSTTNVDCGGGASIMYGDSIICVATVSNVTGDLTPIGMINWNTDGNGVFDPNPCNLTGTAGIATCSATYTPASVGGGAHLITAAYNGNAYFNPSDGSQTVTVVTRPITVTADPQTKVYGGPDPELTYQITQGSLAFNDTFTGTLTREPGEDAGFYAILQGLLALSIDYDLTFLGDFLTVTKADPTCTVIPYNVAYDGNAHTDTGACTGVMDEELAGLDLTGTTHTTVGSYTDPWSFTDVTGNYNDAAGTVNDEITLRMITITVDAKTKLFRQPDPQLTFQITAGSLLSGDAFSGELTREPGEQPGTYAILLGTLSLPDYYNLTYVGTDFTITSSGIFIPLIFR